MLLIDRTDMRLMLARMLPLLLLLRCSSTSVESPALALLLCAVSISDALKCAMYSSSGGDATASTVAAIAAIDANSNTARAQEAGRPATISSRCNARQCC
eukprot:9835-Heterococcus_DN1.PRE.3